MKILNRVQVERFEQTADYVQAYARDLDGRSDIEIVAEYLIGCDGGRSMVRKAIGSRLTGTHVVQRVQSTYIHAPQLKDMIVQKPAWMTMSLNPRRCGTTVAIDGKDNWLIKTISRRTRSTSRALIVIGTSTILGVDDRFATISSARRIGSAAAWWLVAFGTGAPSFAVTPHIYGFPTRATESMPE